jgi:hypothetical protein
MTDTYLRRPLTVRAFLFEGQPQDQWPDWLREHQIATNMGLVNPALANGVMLIPQPHGPTVNVSSGQHVVLERGALARYKAGEFDELFLVQEAETPVAEAEPPTPVFDAPAEKPATRGKAAEPVEAPAADAE